VVIGGFADPELEEDPDHVRLNGLSREDQLLGDRPIAGR